MSSETHAARAKLGPTAVQARARDFDPHVLVNALQDRDDASDHTTDGSLRQSDKPSRTMLKISVLIRAFNEAAHLGRLLTSIASQTRRPDQIVLMDSGSTDRTLDIASEHDCVVRHISPEEFTFGRSLNRGLQHTTGDIVVIPSAHVYPLRDDWIENLISPFRDSTVGMSYGRQVGDASTKYSEQRLLERWFPIDSEPDQRHPFSNNANAAVRRAVWQSHPYDEALTGLEDLDFARRIISSGWVLSYVAEAVVAHIHDEDWPQLRNRYRREAMALNRIFPEETLNRWTATKLAAVNVASDWRAAARDGHFRQEFMNIVRFRANQFIGAYQGSNTDTPLTGELRRRFYYPVDPPYAGPRDDRVLRP